MSRVEHYIRELSSDSLRIHIFPCADGRFQVNVGERVGGGWTVVHDTDVLLGLAEAMRQRACAIPSRVVAGPDEHQLELEEVIAALPADDDDLEAMLG